MSSADNLPAETLFSAVRERGFEVTTPTGSLVLGPALLEEADTSHLLSDSDRHNLHLGAAEFIDPSIPLEATEQLDFMEKFWGYLGHRMPSLQPDELESLCLEIEQSPDKRVIPTPLLGIEDRQILAERGKTFSGDLLDPTDAALWVPITSKTYINLLRDPEGTVNKSGDLYGLRYKTPGGTVVSRSSYIEALVTAGSAIESEDGQTWIFPLVDVVPKTDRGGTKTVGDLYKSISDLSAPETLIVTNLLHIAGQAPNKEYDVDFANEAVYVLDDSGIAKSVMYVVGFRYQRDQANIGLGRWRPTYSDEGFGVRATLSGI